MRFTKACGKYQKKYSLLPRAVFAAIGLTGLCGAVSACPAAASEPQKQAKTAKAPEQILESDLRAFCPPAEFAEGAYAYRIYGSGGALSHQAAIADITRDCRYDRDNGLINMHIAAAGRVVPAAAAARGTLILPIEVRVMRGSKTLFARIYRQKLAVGRGPAQFLLSEWVSVKKAEATSGTKIFIGFARKESEPPARQKPAAVKNSAAKNSVSEAAKAKAPARPGSQKQKPAADRLSPNAVELTIPESF